VRHFVEHPGGLVRVLGVEGEEGACEDGVGGKQALTAYLRVNLVAESVVAAAKQGGVGELVGGGNGWVDPEDAAKHRKSGAMATGARVVSDGGSPGGGGAAWSSSEVARHHSSSLKICSSAHVLLWPVWFSFPVSRFFERWDLKKKDLLFKKLIILIILNGFSI
jgi:hypothetical protein